MSAPPAPPRELAFAYTLQETVSLTQPAPRGHLERWDVAVLSSGRPLGDARVLIINLEAGRDVRDFADVASGEWREPAAPFVEMGAGVGHMLVLERVWVEPEFRGNGLGPIIAAVVIDRLGRGCRLAACYPAPFDGRPEERDREIEALGRIWAKVGFRPWRDGVWMLDLDGSDARSALAALLDVADRTSAVRE